MQGLLSAHKPQIQVPRFLSIQKFLVVAKRMVKQKPISLVKGIGEERPSLRPLLVAYSMKIYMAIMYVFICAIL